MWVCLFKVPLVYQIKTSFQENLAEIKKKKAAKYTFYREYSRE